MIRFVVVLHDSPESGKRVLAGLLWGIIALIAFMLLAL